MSLAATALALLCLAPAPSRAQPADDPLPPAFEQGEWRPPSAAYDQTLVLDQPVGMSDGVELRADIVYPTDPVTGRRVSTRFPVLLEQTPYRGQVPPEELARRAAFFVSRGYIYALVQVRGTHDAGGIFDLLSDREQQDGVELVDWAAHRLDGADGRIALTGCSYTGLNQYLTVARLGPNSPVKAMAPGGVGPNPYREPIFPGGVLSSTGDTIFDYVIGRALGTPSSIRNGLETLSDMRAGGDRAFNGAYWQARAPEAAVPAVVRNGVPVLIWSGWDDVYPSSPELYAMLQNAAAGRDPRLAMAPDQTPDPRYQIIMAPGAHCTGDNGGPRDAAYLRWFETWVKGVDTGLARTEQPLHLHLLDAPGWMSVERYPITSTYSRFYLGEGARLQTDAPRASVASDILVYGASADPRASLTYTTPPFQDGALLAGPSAVDLHASSDGPNLIVIADLLDVAPDGSTTRLSTGVLLGDMRSPDEARTWTDEAGALIRPGQTFARADPLAPGETVDLAIAIQPRLARILPGHAIRLILKTQSDPADCAPGRLSGWPCVQGPLPSARALDGGVYDVRRDAAYPSYVSLPLLPLPDEGR